MLLRKFVLTSVICLFSSQLKAQIFHSIFRPSDSSLHGNFGTAIALSGDHLLVSGQAPCGFSCSQRYIFSRQNNNWVETQVVPAAHWTDGIAIDGSLAVLGNEVYRLQENGFWAYQTTLVASDGANIGKNVRISGRFIVAESHGTAYFFQATTTGWKEIRKIKPHDECGYRDVSIDLEDDLFIMGCVVDTEAGEQSGLAFVYQLHQSRWSRRPFVLAPRTLQAFDQFGVSVDLDATHRQIIVGASEIGDIDNPGKGSAYIYIQRPTSSRNWSLKSKLQFEGSQAGDAFGLDVAIFDKHALISSPFESVPHNVFFGAVLHFKKTATGKWEEYQKYFPPTPNSVDAGVFAAFEIEEDFAYIGRKNDSHFGAFHSGAVYRVPIGD